jgi:putative acetyltransferase
VSDVRIRAMEPDDAQRVAEIYNQRLVASMTLQIPFTSEAERAKRFAPSENDRLLVAELDGRVAGHGGLHLYTRRRAHVASFGMGVDTKYHGRGVGTALLAAIVDLADNWYNIRRIELQVYTDNDAAVRLYQRFGFEIEGTHRSYAFREGAWADAYTMARLRDEPTLTIPVDSNDSSVN